MESNNTIKNMSKTILCRSVTEGGGRCIGRGKCRHAHTIMELYPRMCKYGNRCNRHKDHPETCMFVHPDEDIFSYATTHKFISQPEPVPGPIRRNSYKFGIPPHSDSRGVDMDFSYTTDDFPELISDIALSSSPDIFDLEIGDLGELDDSWSNEGKLPCVFSSKPSPLQRQTSTM